MRRVPLIIVTAAILAAGTADAAPGNTTFGDAPGDPWEARDRFDPSGGSPAHPGRRLVLGVTSWESLDGDLRTTLRLVGEPEGGLGLSAGWRRYWMRESEDADDLETLVVVRLGDGRLAAGAGLLRQGAHRLGRALLRGDARLLGPLLASAGAAVYPAQTGWAPEIVTGLCAARGPWWGSVELGPRSGDLRVSVGLAARAGLAWTTSWTGDHPELGLAWGLAGGAELRAHRTAHPLLGAVQRLSLVAGGLRP